MATANAVFTTSNVKTSLIQNRFLVTGQAVLANVSNINYTTVTGVPFSLAGLAPSQKGTDKVTIQSANALGINTSYTYAYQPVNTANANSSIANGATGNIAAGTIRIFANGNVSTELATGNLPASVQNDVIVFEAYISR